MLELDKEVKERIDSGYDPESGRMEDEEQDNW